MRLECNNCDQLEFNSSKNYLGEVLFGGATYSCKKNYFTLQPYPHQPQECVDGKPPKSPFADIEVHSLTDDEMKNIHNTVEIANKLFKNNKNKKKK